MRAGFTLLEVIVSVLLVAVSIVIIVGLIPTGIHAQKKSENIHLATLYANEVIEDAQRSDFALRDTDMHVEHRFTANDTEFRVTRDIYGIAGDTPTHLFDVVVRVTWNPQPVPVDLRTRIYRP